jgi:hypothetical protein
MVTGVCVLTGEVVTVNRADTPPAGIIVEAGTLATAGFDEVSVTVVGAGDRESIPTELNALESPPVWVVGERDTRISVGARTVRATVLLTPLKVAEMVAVVSCATCATGTAKPT